VFSYYYFNNKFEREKGEKEGKDKERRRKMNFLLINSG